MAAAAPAGWVGLTTGAPDAARAEAALLDAADGGVGAVVAFTGVVRADGAAVDRVDHLAFESYPEMAGAELERIRIDAINRHGLAGLVIEHRTGTVATGAPIVLVVAAARHRKAAFEAAAWTMDEIKRRVPLWKQEVDAAGTARWVTPQGPAPDN